MFPLPCDPLAKETLWTAGNALLFGWLTLLWFRPRASAASPLVREVRVTVDLPDHAPYHDEPAGLRVSLVKEGGPPWVVFPAGVQRRHVERLYDVVLFRGLPPTEANMLWPDHFARTELQALHVWLVQHGMAYNTRAGRRSGWLLNKAGERRVLFCYQRLQGKWITTPPTHPRKPAPPAPVL